MGTRTLKSTESEMAPLRFESDGFGRKTIRPSLFVFSSGLYLILIYLKMQSCQQGNKTKKNTNKRMGMSRWFEEWCFL